ncbi:MFS transporter (plasmid) [Photobacterium sp. GJ3]|uniref:MFS transporter n=1 Tax=Photobacterium sp. GJ3 TaxID=2829502 RepID=UPI001B8D06B8|nr:MFS transporter [Photobacterium sp. GJ3]QUJ69821.1 MFS transporter [Photobacterium sp. GJ3]
MNIFNFLISSAMSLLAFRSFSIIFVWSIATMEGGSNSIILGSIIALMWLINLVSLPLSGDLLDRNKKKKILVFSSVLSVITINLYYVFFYHLEVSFVYLAIVASILATTNSIVTSSINSTIPFLTEKENYTKYIGIAASLNSVQAIAGAILGGGGVALIGSQWSIIIVSAFYIISLFLLFLVKIRGENIDRTECQNFLKSASVGFRILFKINNEKITCYIAMVTNFILTPMMVVILPLYVANNYHDIKPLAYFEVSFAIGMGMGGVILSKIDFNTHKRLKPAVIGNMLIGIGIILFSILELFYFKVFSMIISGFGLSFINIATNSVRSFAVPNEFRARLESAIFFLCVVTIPIGSQSFGYLIQYFGHEIMNTLLFVMGAIVALSSFTFFISKHTREILLKSNDQLDQIYIKKYPSAFKG